MSQSRTHSMLEAIAGTAIGFIVSVIITAIVLPAYGHEVTFSQNIQITAIYTVASIIRGYVMRRAFNQLHLRRAKA